MSSMITCLACGASSVVPDSRAGERLRCGNCDEPLESQADTVIDGAEEDRLDEDGSVGLSATEVLTPLSVALALLAAVVGAGAWAALLSGSQYEVGLLAWGVGGFVGFAAVRAGGRGATMAGVAAAIALLGILGGRWVGTSMLLEKEIALEIESVVESQDAKDLFRETEDDAAAWAALESPSSDEVVAKFMVDRRYTEAKHAREVTAEELGHFRSVDAPELVSFQANPPTYTEWTFRLEEEIRTTLPEISVTDVVIDELSLMSLAFMALGVGTAWRLVMTNSPVKRRSMRNRADVR